MHRAQVFEDSSGNWVWHLKAQNGEVIAQGESHTRRWAAIRAVKRSTDASVIEVFDRKGALTRTITR